MFSDLMSPCAIYCLVSLLCKAVQSKKYLAFMYVPKSEQELVSDPFLLEQAEERSCADPIVQAAC